MAIETLRLPAILLLSAFGLGACGSVHSGGIYHRHQAGEAQYVSRGTILAAREVQIAGERSGLGTIGGGVLGGVGGSMIGKGSRATIAGAAGGAILGAILGSMAESRITQTTATEFTVREESGQLLAVVQANDEGLMPGERVVVLRGSRARVVRDAMPPPASAPSPAYPAPVYPTPGPAAGTPPFGTVVPNGPVAAPLPSTPAPGATPPNAPGPVPNEAGPRETGPNDPGPQILTGPMPRPPVESAPSPAPAPLRS